MKALYILKVVLKDTIMSSEKAYIKEAITELESFLKEHEGNCKDCIYLGVDTDRCLKCSHSYANKFKGVD